MLSTIRQYSGKSIISVQNWHSSTVEFTFANPEPAPTSITETTKDSGKEHSPSLTLDFCVWDLVHDKNLLVSSNDEDLEQKLSVLIGDTLAMISQITRFRKNGGTASDQEDSDYFIVKVTFGSGKKLFIAPHHYADVTHAECESIPLMTLRTRTCRLIYLKNGEIQYGPRRDL